MEREIEGKIYKEYLLLKDTPELKKGSKLYWDLWEEKYTDVLSALGEKQGKTSYSLEFIKGKTEWFKPVGTSEYFHKKFPDNFEDQHFYFGELRHNKMCRFCYDAQSILRSKEYKTQVIKIFKDLYTKKYTTIN